MGSPEFAVAVGRKQYIGNAEVEVVEQTPEAPSRKKASRTARAEGAHITIAHNLNIDTRWATVIPNHRTGAAGAMQPEVMHPTIAMAHAGEGDSHDRKIVIDMGENPESHAAAAEAILEKDRETHEDVSVALDERGTMNKSEIRSVIFDSKRRAEERKVPKATIYVKTEGGERKEIKNVKVERGSVAVVGDVIDLDAERKKRRGYTEDVAATSTPEPSESDKAYDNLDQRSGSGFTTQESDEVVKNSVAELDEVRKQRELAKVRSQLAALQTEADELVETVA